MSKAEKLNGKDACRQTCETLRNFPWDLNTLTSLFPKRVFYYGDEGMGIILTPHIAYITAESAEGLYYSREEIKLRNCGSYKRLANPKTTYDIHEIPENLINRVVSSSRRIITACENFGRNS